MLFPLDPPDDRSIEVMHQNWARHTLDRYLVRWANAYVPAVDERFWSFPHRVVDLGCGLGKHLLAQAALKPDHGFLGIDKGKFRGGGMTERFEAAGHGNLFGLHGNAIPILAAFPDQSLDAITIFYPNPWWPVKHRKKRWSYHPLLPKLAALLRPGGTVLLTSNEAFYLAEWVYALEHHPAAAPLLERVHVGPLTSPTPRSHFETKFAAEGTACGEVVYRRKSLV